MPRNGSGTMSLATPQQAPGNPITAVALWNTTLNDIVNELTNSLPRDGQAPPTANIPMGGFKLTGLGSGTLATDSATFGQLQSGSATLLGTVSGTNTITASSSPAITAYAAGQTFRFISAGANTGAVTLNISGLGAKDVTKNGATPLAANDIPSGAVVEVVYDGTQFQVIGLNLSDAAIAAYNAADPTKRARFSLTNLTTANTRVMTVPDANITLTDRALSQQFATASGTDTYTAGYGPTVTAYITHGFYLIRFTNANTITAPTLNIDGVGAATIVRQGGTALYVGDITANMYALLQYNGTQMVLLNPAVNVATKFVSSDQVITSAGPLTIPHGLPGTPTKLWYGLVNVNPQYGWTAGQILYQSFGPQDNSAAVARGASARADATNIYIRYGSAAAVFVVHQETGTPGLTSAATNGDWRLRVYAEL